MKPVVNGKPENGNIMKLEKEDTAAIIKREIEKMKMRKVTIFRFISIVCHIKKDLAIVLMGEIEANITE